MFSKVLVANRGEIAVRINQTLRVMGIAPVAVYSGPDTGAPHVATAEQSAALPGDTAEETYLNIPRISAGRPRLRGRCHTPRIRLPVGKSRFRPRLPGSSDNLHWPYPGKHGSPRRQAALQGHCPERRGSGGAKLSRMPAGGYRRRGVRGALGVPLAGKGGRRGWRPGYAPRQPAERVGRRYGDCQPRGPGSFRRWASVPGALRCQPPPRGGAGAGRRVRPYHPTSASGNAAYSAATRR